MRDRIARLAHLMVGVYPGRHHTTAQTRIETTRRQAGLSFTPRRASACHATGKSMHSDQQERRIAFYTFGSQHHCSLSGDNWKA